MSLRDLPVASAELGAERVDPPLAQRVSRGGRWRPVERTLILETKGYDPLEHVKREAALRWYAAVNGDGGYGRWSYAVVRRPEEVTACISMSI
ncbi:MAG TPA: hypothetical protein VL334_00905 [Anaerolineae bacterium]|nr:hypothetical protein [Anaerolineae bacterium]